MYWTAVCIGSIASVVQSVVKPYWAPACAYVPIPEGSSSDAPVMRPGPSALPSRFSEFFSARSSAALGSTGRPGSTRGPSGPVGTPDSVAGFVSVTPSTPPLALQLLPPRHQLTIQGGRPDRRIVGQLHRRGAQDERLGLPPTQATVRADELLEAGDLAGDGVHRTEKDQIAGSLEARKATQRLAGPGPVLGQQDAPVGRRRVQVMLAVRAEHERVAFRRPADHGSDPRMAREGPDQARVAPVSYTHLRAHETVLDLVCRLLLEKKKQKKKKKKKKKKEKKKRKKKKREKRKR